MAGNNNWILGYSAPASTASGWSLGHVPTTGEIAVFSNTFGNGSCTFDQNIICSGIVISGSYTGNQSINGYAFYLDDSYIDNGAGGSRNFGSGIIMYGTASQITIGSTVGTITASSCDIKINGSTTIALTKNVDCRTITVIDNGTLITSGGNQLRAIHSSTPIIIGNNTTITINGTLSSGPTAATSYISIGSGVIFNGGGVITLANRSSAIVTVPDITFTGAGASWTIGDAGAASGGTSKFNGLFNIGNNKLSLIKQGSGNSIDCNNQNIICGQFDIQSVGITSGTINFGSGIFNITSYTVTNSGTIDINLQSSTINCSGSFTYGSTHTINPGTSTVNITNTSTVTSAGKYFNNLNCSGAVGNTITLSDQTNLSGNFIGASGALTITSGLAFYGPTTTGTFAAGLGTLTSNNAIFTWNNTNQSIITNKALDLAGLVLGANATVTYSGTDNYLTATSATPLTFTNGGILTLNKVLILSINTTGYAIKILAGAPTINGLSNLGGLTINPVGNNVSAWIPAITISGIPTSIYTGANYTNTSINFSGNMSTQGNLTLGGNSGGTIQQVTVNTNNYSISCSGFIFDGSTALGTNYSVLNCGSSTINCSYFSGILVSNQITTNMSSSTWNCSGNWNFGPNHTINPGTSTVNITNTSTVLTNGKYFNHLNCSGAVGNTITLSDLINLSGNFTGASGALTISSGIVFNGPTTTGTFGAGLGTITATSCGLTFNASGHVLADNKGVSFKSLTIGVSSTLTSNGTSAATYLLGTTTLLTLNNNSTFTLNQRINLLPTANQSIFSFGSSVTWNGTGTVRFLPNAVGTFTFTIPTTTYTGSGTWEFNSGANQTYIYNFTGNFNIGTSTCTMLVGQSANGQTFNFGSGVFTLGAFSFGNNGAGAYGTYNFDSATINCSSVNSTSYNVATVNVNLQSSQWTCTGNWTFGSNWTVNQGTSTVNINNTSTITSSGKMFYDINLSGTASSTYTVSDPIQCRNLTLYSGNYTQNGTMLTCSGNAMFDGSGTLNFGSGITMTGATGQIHVGSTTGASTATSCTLTMNTASGIIDMDITNVYWKNWVIGASCYITNTGTVTAFIRGNVTALTMGAGSTLNNNVGNIYIYPTAAITYWSLGAGYTITGVGGFTLQNDIAGTYTIPEIIHTGTTVNSSILITTYANITYNLSGNLSMGGTFSATATAASVSGVLNTNGYTITSNIFQTGANNATNAMTINFGSGIYNVGSFTNFSNVGTTYLNFQTSTINCSGSWTFASNNIVNRGTSTVNFIGNGGTITSAGKKFYTPVFNASSKTFTLADNMYTKNYTLTAGTINLNGYYIFQEDVDNCWSAAADDTWNKDANWSLGHVPTATEAVIFSPATSTKNCIVDISPTVNNLVTLIDYSGNLTMSGQMITSASGFYDYGPGVKNYGSGITLTGYSGKLLIDSTVGTTTATSCDFSFNSSGQYLTDNKGLSIKSITLSNNSYVTTNGTGITSCSSTTPPLILGTTSTINLLTRINLSVTSTSDFMTVGSGAILNGTADLHFFLGANNISGTIPGFTHLGSGPVYIQDGIGGFTGCTAIIGGNINISGNLIPVVTYSAGSVTYNFNNKNVTCAQFIPGTVNANNTGIFNYGSGTFIVSSYTGASYNTGTCNENFQTSQWICTGNWTFGTTHIIDQGTSTVTINGASTFVNSGKNFYNLIQNANISVNSADTLRCYDFTIASGRYNAGGAYQITSGNFNINGGASHIGPTTLTMTSPTGTFHIDSAVTSISFTSTDIVMSGTVGMTIDDDKAVTFKSLTLGTGAVVTSTGSQTTTFAAGSNLTPITLGANATLTNNSLFVASLTGSPTIISLGSGYTLNGSSRIQFAHIGAGTVTVPAITSATWIEFLVSTTGTTNIEFNGIVNMPSAALNIVQVSTGIATWNTNNYAITCSTFRSGGHSGTGTFIANFGSSIITLATYIAYSNFTNATYNFQSSTWNCTGVWTFGNLHTINPGTSTVNITGTSTITASGKYFNNLTCSGAVANTITLADTINLSGNFTGASGALTISTGLTFNGPTTTGTFGVGLGTVTGTNCSLIFNASGHVLKDNKGGTLKNITLAANATLINNGSATFTLGQSTTPFITLGANSTLTQTAAMSITPPAAHSTLFDIHSTAVWNGVGTYTIDFAYAFNYTLTTFTYTGSGPFNFQTGGNTPIINLSGNVSFGGNLVIYQYGGTGTYTFNTNTFNLTCASLNVGSNAAAGTSIFNFGSSIINCTAMLGNLNVSPNSIFNLGSSTINCSGGWVFGSNHIINPGTSTINITNTGSVVGNGKYFNNLNCSGGVANTITLADTINLSGNFIAASGALTINSGLAFYGPTTTGLFTAGLGTVTATAAALTFNASGHALQDNKQCIFKSLTLGNSSTLTTNGSLRSSFSNAGTPLVLGTSSTLTLSRGIFITSTLGGSDMYTIGAGGIITGTQTIDMINSSSGIVSFPALTSTSTGKISIYGTGTNFANTLNMSGALVLGGALGIYKNNSGGSFTFNTNNYNITCTTIGLQDDGVGGGVYNLGSSTINISSWAPTVTTLTATINMQTSTINCSGSWTYGTNHIINPGTSVVNIIGTSNITGSSKYFNRLNCSGNSASTITFVDVILLSGNLNLTSSGTVVLGNGFTMYGPNTYVLYDSSLSAVSSNSAILTFNSTNHTLINNKSNVLLGANIVLGANTSITTSGNGSTANLRYGTTKITIGNSGILTNNIPMQFYIENVNEVPWSLGVGASIGGSGNFTIFPDVGTVSCNLKAIVYTGTGTITIKDSGGQGMTAYQTGFMNLGSGNFTFYGSSAGSNMILNTSGYGFSCGVFTFGNTSASATCVANFINDTFNISSFVGNVGAGNTLNMGSSIINCSGNWTYGATSNINPGTSIVNILPITNTNIISNNKAFATLNFSGINPLATGFFVDTPIISGNLGIYNGSSVNSSGLNISITSGCYITTSGNFSASGIYTIGKDLTFGSGTALNNSGMTLTLSGQAHTITTGDRNFPYTKVYNNSTWVGSGTLARLSLYAPTTSTTHTWQAGQIYRFTSYTANDWSGTDFSHQILMRSSAAGFQSTFYAPASTVTRFIDYKDINNLGSEIDASDGTGIDSGNNYGINFGGAIAHPRRPHDKNDVDFFIITKTFRW